MARAARQALSFRLREACRISPKRCRTRSPSGAVADPKNVRDLVGPLPARCRITALWGTIAPR